MGDVGPSPPCIQQTSQGLAPETLVPVTTSPVSPLPAAALSPWPTAVGHHIPNKNTLHAIHTAGATAAVSSPLLAWCATTSSQVTAVGSTTSVRHGGHTERPRGAPGRNLNTRLGSPLESEHVPRLPVLVGQPGTQEEGASRWVSRWEAGEDGRW